MTTPSYYAITPAKVRYDRRLKANEKLLYAELTALTQIDGYSLATNKFFADLYGVSKDTVSRWLSNLQACGYIRIEIDEMDHSSRRIYIVLPEEEQNDIDEKINTHDEKINTHDEKINTHDEKINTHDKKINTHDKKINTHDEKINTLSNFHAQGTLQSTPKSQPVNSPFHSQNTSPLHYTTTRNYGEYQGNNGDGESDFHSQGIPQSTLQSTPHDENDITSEKKNKEKKSKEKKKNQEKKKLEKNKQEKNNIYNPHIYKYISPPCAKKAVRHKHGEYNNVLFTDDDYEKLKEKRPDDYQEWIDKLSAYMASTGKVYKNHYVTICNWIRREQGLQEKQAIQQRNEYSYEGGETL